MFVRVMNNKGGMSCISMIDQSPEMCTAGGGDRSRRFSVQEKLVALAKDNKGDDQKRVKLANGSSSSSASSIGKNSDISSGKSVENSGDSTDEVQSTYKGPFDAMEALEEVLPMRRGISRFYNGKSKSFASLAADLSSTSSMKDLAKPENAYMRRRRNLLASSLLLKSNGGGVSKKVTSANRTTTAALALAVTMTTTGETNTCNATTIPASPLLRSSCLNPQLSSSSAAWRSYSLADLQTASSTCIASTATPLNVKPSSQT